MKIAIKTKASKTEIAGDLSMANEYTLNVYVSTDFNPYVLNTLVHSDGANVSVYKTFISISIDTKKVESYEIY